MRKLKLIMVFSALLLGWSNLWAAADFASATYSDPFTVTISNSNFENSLTDWTVEASDAGFVSHSGNGGHIAEIYDKTNAVHYIKRTISNLKTGHYRLSFSAGARGNNNAGRVYAYIGDKQMTINGEPFSSYVIDYDLATDGSVEIGLSTTANHTAQWVAFDDVELKYYGSTSDYITARNKAVFTSGTDLTSLIVNADISKVLGNWPLTSGSCGNQQGGSGAMESWNNNNMTVAQTIVVPNGKYRVTVDMISGNDTKQAYLFASSGGNEVHSDVVSAQSASGRDNYANMCEDVTGKTLTIDNFSVTDGSITIGVKDPSNGGWIVFDNFTLTRISIADGTDFTTVLNNAAVTSTTGWTNGRTNTGQQYTDAPDNTYMDTWNGNLDQNQTVKLPEGYYLLKAATRADANVTVGNIYAYAGGGNLGSANIHAEGSSGNLLGNGWGWTYVPFNVDERKDVKIGFYSECGSQKWAGADDFHLYYYTTEFAMKQAQLTQVVADANAWAGKVAATPALETILSASTPSCSTVAECETAISDLTTAIVEARAVEAPYAEFNRIKAGANSIKDVERTEKESGAYTTFTGAISTQTSAADDATTAAAVNTAINALKSAVKTYISKAEPKNEGEYFDVTCLMTNPNFDDSHNGWTYIDAPGVSWSNCEYYMKEFDINQTVTGLPTGSYSLNVQAFQRPGWAGAVYDDYIGGTDNASSVLYINSITSKVKNIAADAQTTSKLGDSSNYGTLPYDSQVGSEGSYKYLPNSQQGANLYFGAGLYDATCAAVVTEEDGGSLKLGFKSTKAPVNGDWTIFDNFRLRYYGSSLLVYYQQYWPQLKEEVSADLANAAYTNVLVSSEDEAVDAALAATPSTEAEYETAINNLTNARDNFRAAATPYDAIVAEKAASAMTKISENIGTGVFQYNETTNNSLYSAYETARANVTGYTFTTSSTAAAAQALVDALDEAVENYNNQALNAPDPSKRYVLTIVEAGKDWDGKAVTFMEGVANSDEGNFGIKYLTTSNANLNQAIKFTAVSSNKYKMSVVSQDGTEMYMTTQKLGYDKDNGTYGDERIRMTSNSSKALEIEIRATSTVNQFQLYNSTAPGVIANNDNNDMYTANECSFTIAEAAQASVNVNISAAVKYGTRIFPFKPTLPSGVKAYSCGASEGNTLTLVEVADPVANTPYILETSADVDETLSGWGVLSSLEATTAGWLTGVYTNTPAEDGWYVLQNNDDKVGFYLVNTSVATPTVGANRCYLQTSGAARAAFFFNEEITGINTLDVLTCGNATIYDANGRQVSTLQKGMNIVKSKDKTYKIIVK